MTPPQLSQSGESRDHVTTFRALGQVGSNSNPLAVSKERPGETLVLAGLHYRHSQISVYVIHVWMQALERGAGDDVHHRFSGRLASAPREALGPAAVSYN